MNVIIRTIPHKEQRYDTAGDWWWEGDTLQIRVSASKDPANWEYPMLVAYHEFHEALLCYGAGIAEEEVTAFDTGPGRYLADPGRQPDAPYHREHMCADVAERQLALNLGVDWDNYDLAFSTLEYR